ncbi:hypothetical protein AB0I52_12840 [Streptomyces sp. NPDC050423]|uniref:hypothetical protein n=1 Tax=Streptomyces sp. NPDC050423 TaxID=3155402 RepID=UPI003437796A
MNGPGQVRPSDRIHFERVLDQALNSPSVREALSRADGAVNAEQLRTRALAASAEIAAVADAEYRGLLRGLGRTDTSGGVRPSPGSSSDFRGGLMTALVVLMPSVVAVASALFLLLGYGLRLSGAQPHLADGLVTAGWTAALVAAAAALAGIIAMIVAASRNRSTSYDAHSGDERPEVERERERWQRALLERGMVPFLHRGVRESLAGEGSRPPARPALPGAADTARDRPPSSSDRGFTAPGYASPDFSSPDFAGPGSSGAE